MKPHLMKLVFNWASKVARAEIWFKIAVTSAPLANSAMMSTLTVHCQWEDEMVRERTGHPPSCAEAKKMKSLTLHTHGCPKVSLRDCSSSYFSSYSSSSYMNYFDCYLT